MCVLTFTLTPSWLLQTVTSEGHLDTGRAYGAIRLLSLVGVLPMVLGDAFIFYTGRGEGAAASETPSTVAKSAEGRATAMLFTVLFFAYEAIVEICIVYVLLFINCISKQILGWGADPEARPSPETVLVHRDRAHSKALLLSVGRLAHRAWAPAPNRGWPARIAARGCVSRLLLWSFSAAADQ